MFAILRKDVCMYINWFRLGCIGQMTDWQMGYKQNCFEICATDMCALWPMEYIGWIHLISLAASFFELKSVSINFQE